MGKRDNFLPSRDRPPNVGRLVQNLVTLLITVETECADTQNSSFYFETNVELRVFFKYCAVLQCNIR
jgi:hypothetical protein